MMMFVQPSGAGMDIPLLLCRGSSFVLSEGYCLSCLAISMIRIYLGWMGKRTKYYLPISEYMWHPRKN